MLGMKAIWRQIHLEGIMEHLLVFQVITASDNRHHTKTKGRSPFTGIDRKLGIWRRGSRELGPHTWLVLNITG